MMPMDKMKIGYEAKRAVQNATGLGNYSRYVVEALQTYFPDNSYALYAPNPRDNRRLDALIAQSKGCTTLHFPDKGLWKRLSGLWRIGPVCRQLERDGIQLYHGLSNELPLNIRSARGVKSVVTIHDLIYHKLPQCFHRIDRWIYHYKTGKACRQADHIIAVSQCTKRDIIELFGIPADRISVIYQGCDPAFSQPVPDERKAEVRARYRLPARYVLSVGSIEERKNMLLAVKALHHLPADVSVVLVGRHTPYTDQISAYASAHGLTGRLHICSGVPFADLPAIYQCATSFAYPSRYEGFGIPILEALHSHLPVVAATGSCLEEAGGPDQLYVSPDDERALADALLRTFDESVRSEMTAKGLEWAKRFTLRQMADETMKCYRELLLT